MKEVKQSWNGICDGLRERTEYGKIFTIDAMSLSNQ